MRRKRRIVISILILVIVALAAGCAYCYHTISAVANIQTICDGVAIDGCDVSGLSREDALETVTSWEEKLADTKVTITYEEHTEQRTLKQLGYSYSDWEKAVDKAYEIGKQGSMWERYKAIKKGEGKGTDIAIEKSITESDFQDYIEDNADHFVKVAENATITRENGEFVITDEQKGMEVPVSENVTAFNEYLNQSWNQEAFTYELQVEVAEPEYTREDMEKITEVLGTYTTNFASST